MDDDKPAAGRHSPNLDPGEQDLAAEHSSPEAVVIHEIVREEGETALQRTPGALVCSGLAAGLSMGFSFLVPAGIPTLTGVIKSIILPSHDYEAARIWMARNPSEPEHLGSVPTGPASDWTGNKRVKKEDANR
jgi:hypothetical protein